MDTATSRIGRSSLIFSTMVLGLLAVWAGGSDLARLWSVLASGARICDVLILASGALLLASGVVQFAIRTMRRVGCVMTVAGAMGFSATLFGGVWSGAIPCSGPN